MAYPCTGCGECCRRLGKLLEGSHEHPVIAELIRRFPYKTRRDGTCEMLSEDGRCYVYEHRPLICNIKLGGLILGIEEKEWYRMNMEGCNRVMDEAGVDMSLRVTLEENDKNF